MEIKQIMQEIHQNNIQKGFWEDKETKNVGEVLMLCVSELSEAFTIYVKDTFEDEIADTVIRLFDLCSGFGIDLEWHIQQKMNFNKLRPYKHGKVY